MMICLTYPVTKDLCYYKGKKPYIESKIVDTGEKYNQETCFSIDSHIGTHIDFPAHFYKNGKYGDQYPTEYFVFNRIGFIEIDCLSERKISVGQMQNSLNSDIELLLIKTGFSALRLDEKYWKESPIVSSDLAVYLRLNFPKLRVVGFDIISLTSQLDKEEGRKAHLQFLDENKGEILVIEDMDLSMIKSETDFKEVIAAPLIYDKMDGAPCTVIAKI